MFEKRRGMGWGGGGWHKIGGQKLKFGESFTSFTNQTFKGREQNHQE